MFKHFRQMFSLPRLALVNPKGSISLLLSISTVVLHHRDIATVDSTDHILPALRVCYAHFAATRLMMIDMPC